MRSIGVDLDHWVKKGLLQFQAARPTAHGLEMHLAIIHKTINDFVPRVVVVDPVTNLMSVGNLEEVKARLTRLIDFMRGQQIRGLCTRLTDGEGEQERTAVGTSSLMDTWILRQMIESTLVLTALIVERGGAEVRTADNTAEAICRWEASTARRTLPGGWP